EPFHSPTYCASTAYPSSSDCQFQTPQFDLVRQHGVIPLLDWGSNNDALAHDPGYTDSAIAQGSQDGYITQFAKDAKAWGHPFFLRFDWEMNGNWFNWGVNSEQGNSAADFVAMWRHVHDVFARVGASNVTWVWCPNVQERGTAPLS